MILFVILIVLLIDTHDDSTILVFSKMLMQICEYNCILWCAPMIYRTNKNTYKTLSNIIKIFYIDLLASSLSPWRRHSNNKIECEGVNNKTRNLYFMIYYIYIYIFSFNHNVPLAINVHIQNTIDWLKECENEMHNIALYIVCSWSHWLWE